MLVTPPSSDGERLIDWPKRDREILLNDRVAVAFDGSPLW